MPFYLAVIYQRRIISIIYYFIYYGTFVLFLPVSVRGIGTAHFGFEGRNKEHKDPRLSISTLTGPWVK